VRKLFDRLDIPYRSIDLDSVTYQQGDLGGRIRAVLQARTGAATIPQIYIGGGHVGGCTDLFDAWRDGNAQARLTAAGVTYAAEPLDPYTLLPKWLHPRQSAA
jgi:cysteine synthase